MDTTSSPLIFILVILGLIAAYFILEKVIGFIVSTTYDMIDESRRTKHKQLFAYINSYNSLAKTCNEIYKKEYLPNRNKIDYYYDHVKYFTQAEIKNRQLGLECQKQSLEKAQKDIEKVQGNAQKYYELIKEYTKTHGISWADEYI